MEIPKFATIQRVVVYMRTKIYLLFFSFISLQVHSQTGLVGLFDLPVRIEPVTFAGNFGELRSNHFHGGLDFKTAGVTGKPVYAMADGYISRVRVNSGSGYVLNVTYHNGYTAIYRHLSAFMPALKNRVEALEYQNEKWEVDFAPNASEYPVKKGQQIAWSGNTGYSMGPHLHLDLIEDETDEFVDPLPFFQDRVIDKVAPTVEGLALFPRWGKGVVNQSSDIVELAVPIRQEITAWGEIGLGIKAFDRMNGVNNRYGVRHVELIVDGKEVFRSDVGRFSEDENPYIYSWTHGQYMKSFIEPGNKLRMLRADPAGRGRLLINEERPYQIEYRLADLFGNTSTFKFTVKGAKQELKEPRVDEKYLFRWDRSNYLQQPGFGLLLPEKNLADDLPLDFSQWLDEGAIAYTYQLVEKPVHLFHFAELKIGLLSQPIDDLSKYYIVQITRGKNRETRSGITATFEDGFLKARVGSLGTFTAAIDTVAPEIRAINAKTWGKTGKLVLKATDKETSVVSYKGYIDGQFALFGKLNSYTNQLECRLDPARVAKGKNHRLEFIATDACGNVRKEYFQFYW